MKRGDFVTIAMQGDYGKPRPALIIQADEFSEHPSATLLPVSSTLVDAPLCRVNVKPNVENSLKKISQVMIDKSMTVKREKIGQPFGHIDDDTMMNIERCLALFLGIGRRKRG
ncbi:MAG: type II toxin-antitoxin system PemK/MazF family toxin [Desulfovibrio sp.]|nr:type II toxin-antitoxin system PemK/MazF family toxin [Desulfovibrio sp.]